MPIPSVKFQSTRPVWGATLHRFPSQTRCQISIHAPRVGRDDSPSWLLLLPLQFQSTRPVWGATPERVYVVTSFIFQSTRPVWGATSANPSAENPSTDFNPRAPCGARLATYTSGARGLGQSISIHAPRVGRDAIALTSYSKAKTNFNPRAPCGARRSLSVIIKPSKGFQSTRPVWGATVSTQADISRANLFQSTRPVWGATTVQ